MSGLDGSVVVVTGASSGLGEQLARTLWAAGAIPVYPTPNQTETPTHPDPASAPAAAASMRAR